MNTIQAPIHSGFEFSSTAKEVIGKMDLKGKVVIVTGGYSGIGLETAKALAEAGASVIVPARSVEKAKKALVGIPNIEVESLDLINPESIEQFTKWFLSTERPLDLLINSAGIMAPPLVRDDRGFESQLAINHLGHFQLTKGLFPALKKAGKARVVTVSSRAQRLGGVLFDDPNFENTEYDKWKAYAQSKTANILFSVELDKRAKKYGIRAFAVHPGLIPTTGIGRFMEDAKPEIKQVENNTQTAAKEQPDDFKTIEQGAATTVWCAISPRLVDMGGVYCEDCDIAEAVPADSIKGNGVRPWAINPEYAERLWKLSEELTGVPFEI